MIKRPKKSAVSMSLFLACLLSEARAGGVMRPSDSAYPARLLRQTVAEVKVDIEGLIAETHAYAEFRNDWDRPVDAVYSFPLPEDAHVTRLWYARGDTVVDAVLKEVPQTTVPGRGEGGFAAELESFLGKNKASLQLKSIRAGGVQKVEIRYIQKLTLENGRVAYRHPLAMGRFLPEAVSHLGITVNLRHAWPVADYASMTHAAPWKVLAAEGNRLSLRYEQAKAFLEKDFEWTYAPRLDDFALSSMSCKQGDSAGYLAVSLLPPPSAAEARPRSVLFLLDKSRSMSGFKLQQSAAAIKAALAGLTAADRFAIGAFDFAHGLVLPFRAADATAKAAAQGTLDSLGNLVGIGATSLREGVKGALAAFSGNGMLRQVFLFSDGFSSFQPEEIRNPDSVQVFALGMGRDLNRARLEALAEGNHGLAVMFREESDIPGLAASLIASAGRPDLTAATLSASGSGLTQRVPSAGSGTLFGWGGQVLAARYAQAGSLPFQLKGIGPEGPVTRAFAANLSADSLTAIERTAERFWAARKIRELENRIDLLGMDAQVRAEVVRISLGHKVKSRYTSYRADNESLPGDPVPGGPISAGIAESGEPHVRFTARKLPGTGGFDIQVGLPLRGAPLEMQIALYDLQGRLIRLLARKAFPGGDFRLTWDGRDGSGRLVTGTVVLILQDGPRIHSRLLAG